MASKIETLQNDNLSDYSARLEAVLNTVIDGIITINDQGIIQSFNPAAERIFGYRPDEVIGQNVKMLMPDPYHSEHDGYLNNYLKTGEAKVIGMGREVEAQRKDGSVFPMELGINEMNISGQKMFVGSIRDITQRKQAEDEIMRSNEELERFAYIASHDLQEPLRMVGNFTQLLHEEYEDRFDKQGQEYMDFIIDGARRMQGMIGDLLEYSRIGREEANFTSVDAKTHADLALANLKEIIDETGADIQISDLPTIQANPVRFTSLLQNLTSNALKYRDQDRTPKIKITAQDQGDEWLFAVKDNGIGIKEEYLEQIFMIFKRLHSKREYQGTGIGLTICKKIVESFGGQIWAESKGEKGSTFYFTIPKAKKLRSAA